MLSHIQLSETTGSSLIISLFDIDKFFDLESATDVHYKMYKSNVKGKVYRLLYLLNQNIRIRVRTAVGVTEAANTGPGIGQGTIPGAIESAVGLDAGVKEFFHGEDDEDEREEEEDDNYVVKYDDIKIHPLIFQDDLMSPSNSVKAAQRVNDKMEQLMESKLLDLNKLKSVFIVVGEKKARKKMQREVDRNPLLLYNEPMKQVSVEKYLGFQVADTVAASIAATVTKRLGIATRAIYEAKAVVEDSRAEAVGGLVVMFDIWEHSISPMLYSGCEVWPEVPKKTLKSLFNITVTYLRVALGLGKKGGAPLVSLFWHTGTMLPENRILLNNMLFLHHVANLPDKSLAKEFYLAEKKNSYKGIISKCEKYLSEWGITNVNLYTKYQWKRAIQYRLYKKNRAQLLEWIKQYKKLDHQTCCQEKFELKEYFKTMNIQQSRLYFKIQNFITPTVRLNFKSDRKFKSEKWQ